jgi:hypothetical protein
MTDPTTGQPAVTRLLDQQESQGRTLTELLVAVAEIKTKLDVVCSQRQEQHQEHTGCLAARETAFETNANEHDRIWERLNLITTWWKAFGIVGGIAITILSILNLLFIIGVKI